QLARGKELERSGSGIGHLLRCALFPSAAAGDEDAGTDTNLDEPRDLERDHGLAHRSSRYPEERGELAFGGQARAHRILAIFDERRDLPGDLPVEPKRLDYVQRHESPKMRRQRFALPMVAKVSLPRIARARSQNRMGATLPSWGEPGQVARPPD